MELAIDDRRKAFIAPDVIMSMLVKDDPTGNQMLEKAEVTQEIMFITSDFALYEALTALETKEIVLDKLIRFLFAVHIVPSPKIRMTNDRKKHLRGIKKNGRK
jgi:hypothetical protein